MGELGGFYGRGDFCVGFWRKIMIFIGGDFMRMVFELKKCGLRSKNEEIFSGFMVSFVVWCV